MPNGACLASRLQCIDKFFSSLPLMILSCHLLLEVSGYCQTQVVRTAILGYALSSAIKSAVRRERRVKSYSFVPWKLIQRLECLKSNYGFPSNHAVFYTCYFLCVPSVSTFVLMLAGSYSRVLYQHHTPWEVHSSIALTLLTKRVLEAVGRITLGALKSRAYSFTLASQSWMD